MKIQILVLVFFIHITATFVVCAGNGRTSDKREDSQRNERRPQGQTTNPPPIATKPPLPTKLSSRLKGKDGTGKGDGKSGAKKGVTTHRSQSVGQEAHQRPLGATSGQERLQNELMNRLKEWNAAKNAAEASTLQGDRRSSASSKSDQREPMNSRRLPQGTPIYVNTMMNEGRIGDHNGRLKGAHGLTTETTPEVSIDDHNAPKGAIDKKEGAQEATNPPADKYPYYDVPSPDRSTQPTGGRRPLLPPKAPPKPQMSHYTHQNGQENVQRVAPVGHNVQHGDVRESLVKGLNKVCMQGVAQYGGMQSSVEREPQNDHSMGSVGKFHDHIYEEPTPYSDDLPPLPPQHSLHHAHHHSGEYSGQACAPLGETLRPLEPDYDYPPPLPPKEGQNYEDEWYDEWDDEWDDDTEDDESIQTTTWTTSEAYHSNTVTGDDGERSELATFKEPVYSTHSSMETTTHSQEVHRESIDTPTQPSMETPLSIRNPENRDSMVALTARPSSMYSQSSLQSKDLHSPSHPNDSYGDSTDKRPHNGPQPLQNQQTIPLAGQYAIPSDWNLRVPAHVPTDNSLILDFSGALDKRIQKYEDSNDSFTYSFYSAEPGFGFKKVIDGQYVLWEESTKAVSKCAFTYYDGETTFINVCIDVNGRNDLLFFEKRGNKYLNFGNVNKKPSDEGITKMNPKECITLILDDPIDDTKIEHNKNNNSQVYKPKNDNIINRVIYKNTKVWEKEDDEECTYIECFSNNDIILVEISLQNNGKEEKVYVETNGNKRSRISKQEFDDKKKKLKNGQEKKYIGRFRSLIRHKK